MGVIGWNDLLFGHFSMKFQNFFSPETYVELNKFFKKIFFPVNLLTKADWAEIGGSHIFD